MARRTGVLREHALTTKWRAGPTGVVTRQQGPWALGTLANHRWCKRVHCRAIGRPTRTSPKAADERGCSGLRRSDLPGRRYLVGTTFVQLESGSNTVIAFAISAVFSPRFF